MKNKGLFIGLGVAAVAAAAFVGKKMITDAKGLKFGLSKYFKLSNIKLLTSDLSVGIKVTNPGSNVVSATNLTAVGDVFYMGKGIVSINQTQSISLQPGEEKVITVGARINHFGALRAIMAIIIQGKADTKLDLKGNINYSGFNVPINQTLDLIKEGGITGIGSIGGFFDDAVIHNLDELKKVYFKLVKVHHPDAGGSTRAFQDLQNEYDKLFKKVLAGSTLNTEEKAAETVIDEHLRKAIDSIINLPGITIELVGKWIWVSGLTFPIKDALKAAGFTFIKKAGVPYWIFKGVESEGRGKLSIDEIKAKYGSKNFNGGGGKFIGSTRSENKFYYHISKVCDALNGRIGSSGYIGKVLNLEIEDVRKAHIKLARALNGRYAVVVKNSHWKTYGVQYWTPEMITKKIIPNTDNTNSIYIELL